MDKETIIAFFNQGTETLEENIITISDSGKESTHLTKINRPNKCNLNENCICLLRDAEISLESAIPSNRIVTYKEIVCNPLELYLLRLKNSKAIFIRSNALSWGQKSQNILRERAVYIEKDSGDSFGLCENLPCLS